MVIQPFPESHGLILLVEDDPNQVIFIRRSFDKVHIPNPLHVVTNGQDAIVYISLALVVAGSANIRGATRSRRGPRPTSISSAGIPRQWAVIQTRRARCSRSRRSISSPD